MPSTSTPAIPADVALAVRDTDDLAVRKVLGAFVKGGRIVSFPAKQSKQLILLDRVAMLFEPGRTYEEVEVNRILLAVYDDYVTLRRTLVDFEFLDREFGIYWRCGGTFDIQSDV
ncbi:DUF2087 domain-containing protein [Flindersiella endophytica]